MRERERESIYSFLFVFAKRLIIDLFFGGLKANPHFDLTSFALFTRDRIFRVN